MLIGDQRPRLQSLPVYSDSKGRDVWEFAAASGLYLDDWQKYSLDNFMGVQNRKWSAFEILLIVSRQNGKDTILEARELAGLYLFKTDRLILHTAHEHKTSAEHYERIRGLISQNPELEREIKRESAAFGREFIELKAAPTIILGAGGKWVQLNTSHKIIFIARSGGSGRGFVGDLVVYNEAMILDAVKVAASLPSLLARPNPQVWYVGSAGIGAPSTQMAAVRRRANREKKSPALAYMEWSINPHTEYCEPACDKHDDPAAESSIAKANPGYGIRLTQDMMTKAKEAFSDDPEGFATEILGVGKYPAMDNAWLVIPEEWWKATALFDVPERFRNPVFAIAVSWDRKHGAIAVAGLHDGNIAIQLVDYQQGTKWIVDRAVELQQRYGPNTRFIIDPHAAAGSLIDEIEEKHLKVETVTASDVARACGSFFDGVRDKWLWHIDDKALTKALGGADQRPLSGYWAWDKKNSSTDICSLVAVTLALWGYMKFGKQAPPVKLTVKQVIDLVKAGRYGIANLFGTKWFADDKLMDLLRTHDMLNPQTIAELNEAGIEVPDSEGEDYETS